MSAKHNDLRGALDTRLSEAAREALRRAVVLAERRSVRLYLVGGAVRDLLLGASHLDIDLVVEGDAIDLASRVSRELEARLVAHTRFGTAVVRGEGYRLDFARARRETYERPGALPTVARGQLDDDLARRDFTINAMALRLAGDRAGQLLDPHGGRSDLAARRVRVLHDQSFRDDATRILRALRYAGRLGFELESHTQTLLRRDLSLLATISGARLRREFEYIAAEAQVTEIVSADGSLGVLRAVHPALSAGGGALAAIGRLDEVARSHRDAVLLCLLLSEAPPAAVEEVVERLHLTGRQADAVRGFVAVRAREAELARTALRPSEAARVLADYPAGAVEAFALVAREPLAAERARRYVDEWRFVRPRLNGHDVRQLGVPHGPQIGEALAMLKEARVDGRANRREDEVELIERLRTGRPSAGSRRG